MSEKFKRYLRCRIGQQWYGIDVDQVIEVLNLILFTEVLGAAAHVLGMMTLRAKVMPVLDLRVYFSLDDKRLNLDTPVIAVATAHKSIALVVDDVDDIIEVDTSMIIPNEDNISPYIIASARLSDYLLMLLHVDALGMDKQ